MSNTGATPTPLNADQETALGHLASVITEHQGQGRPIPCRGHKGKGSPWLSDNATDHPDATEACGHCPAVRACGAYALAWAEPAGVWGGMTPKSREHFRRTTNTTRSAAA
ncbi:hypothetical protein DEJ38_06545 [Kocuria rosea]|uniref:WhiB family transcriptional regulator n=1 Tax=Kocuria rosea TaxID=1275 RepID=UPI000D613F61|nr:WhiB family transcriptional regulator [Kocuria rosea]PWD94481.1 hypothetical protein DEQ16_15845 [Dietzia maris]PWF82352.1 hypothetical protein DEJ38_06545 [Kocuria rosea]